MSSTLARQELTPPIIRAVGLRAGYSSVPVIDDVELEVHAGEIVALLGPNGAGKSTTLATLSGELTPQAGSVEWKGRVTRLPTHLRARGGLAFVTEERSIFSSMTTGENLRLGRGGVAAAVALMPELRPLLGRRAGLLSGGEQQMLALARALAQEPELLLVDELSLGLAPIIVDRLLVTLKAAAGRGTGILLVEQHVRQALRTADRAYVLARGKVVMSGRTGDLRSREEEIEASYLSRLDVEGG